METGASNERTKMLEESTNSRLAGIKRRRKKNISRKKRETWRQPGEEDEQTRD